MRKIHLSNGQFVLVDNEDFEFLISIGSWHKLKTGYAAHTFNVDGKSMNETMHRILMSPPKGMHTDHINGNKLDNRKSNLRICTPQQNQHNRFVDITNKTGFKGVYIHTQNHNFVAQIQIPLSKKRLHLGSYNQPEEAAHIYNQFAEQLFGEFARLNEL